MVVPKAEFNKITTVYLNEFSLMTTKPIKWSISHSILFHFARVSLRDLI